MSETKRKLVLPLRVVNEFANKHNLSVKEAFQLPFSI